MGGTGHSQHCSLRSVGCGSFCLVPSIPESHPGPQVPLALTPAALTKRGMRCLGCKGLCVGLVVAQSPCIHSLLLTPLKSGDLGHPLTHLVGEPWRSLRMQEQSGVSQHRALSEENPQSGYMSSWSWASGVSRRATVDDSVGPWRGWRLAGWQLRAGVPTFANPTVHRSSFVGGTPPTAHWSPSVPQWYPMITFLAQPVIWPPRSRAL